RTRYANDDAITLYQEARKQLTGLGAGTAGASAWTDQAAHVDESLGDLFGLAGRRQEARDTYQMALAEASGRPHQVARLQRKQGKTWELDRQHQRAIACYEQA